MNDAIIFDLDGTLWNASASTTKGWNKGLEELGISKKITVKEIEKVTGKPHKECVEILFPNFKKYPTFFETLDSNEKKIIESEGGILYDDEVADGIKKLSKKFPLFIVSNCLTWYLKAFLKSSGLEKYIKDFDCCEMSGAPKNEMIANLKNKYFLKNPIYIGDTVGDQEAAKLAQVEFAYVSYGFGETKKKCLTFSSFPELVKYFII
ncbi:MAG: HAD family hydrolase [bacterium]